MNMVTLQERRETRFEEKEERKEIKELDEANRQVREAAGLASGLLLHLTSVPNYEKGTISISKVILEKLKAARKNLKKSRGHAKRIVQIAGRIIKQVTSEPIKGVGWYALTEDEKQVLLRGREFHQVLNQHLEHLDMLIDAAEKMFSLQEKKNFNQKDFAEVRNKLAFISQNTSNVHNALWSDINTANFLLGKTREAERLEGSRA